MKYKNINEVAFDRPGMYMFLGDDDFALSKIVEEVTASTINAKSIFDRRVVIKTEKDLKNFAKEEKENYVVIIDSLDKLFSKPAKTSMVVRMKTVNMISRSNIVIAIFHGEVELTPNMKAGLLRYKSGDSFSDLIYNLFVTSTPSEKVFALSDKHGYVQCINDGIPWLKSEEEKRCSQYLKRFKIGFRAEYKEE